MDQVVELDEAGAKLHTQRQKVEKSKNKLEKMAEKLALQQDILKQRDCDLKVQVVFSLLTLSAQLQNKTQARMASHIQHVLVVQQSMRKSTPGV